MFLLNWFRYNYGSIIVKERSDSFLNSSRLINSSARLPILFCLDVSASMDVSRDKKTPPPIQLLNEAVGQLVKQLQCELPMAEAAFLTFSEREVGYVPFQSLADLVDVEFKVVANQRGTRLAHAVEIAVKRIEDRVKELNRSRVQNYAPFLIVVTDGDEGDRKKADIDRAQNLIHSHCRQRAGEKNLIVPFVIGVGEDVSLEKLKGYSGGFEAGTFRLKNHAQIQACRAVFRIVGDSIGISVDLNADQDNLLDTLDQRIREGIDRSEFSYDLENMWDHIVGGETAGENQ